MIAYNSRAHTHTQAEYTDLGDNSALTALVRVSLPLPLARHSGAYERAVLRLIVPPNRLNMDEKVNYSSGKLVAL